MKLTNKKIMWSVMKKMLFDAYKWGGDDFTGWDCSGAVQEVLMSVGLDPKGDQSSRGLYAYFKLPMNGLIINRKKIKFGTLLFFGRKDHISHVAIAITDTLMWEAGGGGSKTKTKEDAARLNAYIRFRPINRRSDLVAQIMPKKL